MLVKGANRTTTVLTDWIEVSPVILYVLHVLIYLLTCLFAYLPILN